MDWSFVVLKGVWAILFSQGPFGPNLNVTEPSWYGWVGPLSVKKKFKTISGLTEFYKKGKNTPFDLRV
jgi:hypothetical protein